MFVMKSNLATVLFFATAVLSQSEIRGSINNTAPYGIPPATFNELTSNPTQQGTYAAAGFNISVKSSDTSSPRIDGWLLNVAVTADVPLKDANASIDKSKVTETTVLSLLAPANLTTYDEKIWTICALVFPRLNTTAVARQGNGTDGDCSGWVGEECATKILDVNVAGNDQEHHCAGTATLDAVCSPYFEDGDVVGTAFTVDGEALEDGRFYAIGSLPTSAGDSDAIDEAENHVWPITMTWMEDGSWSGDRFSQCIQAKGGNRVLPATVGHPSSGSNRLSLGIPYWQIVLMWMVAAIFLG